MPNFYKSQAIFGVAAPWGCTLLQFENQDLGLRKKADGECSFGRGIYASIANLLSRLASFLQS